MWTVYFLNKTKKFNSWREAFIFVAYLEDIEDVVLDTLNKVVCCIPKE